MSVWNKPTRARLCFIDELCIFMRTGAITYDLPIIQVHDGADIMPTGAGKTTIINLHMRFYDMNQGTIKIDGVDIRDMERDDLRSLFGMVLQDTWLFSGKIKDMVNHMQVSKKLSM